MLCGTRRRHRIKLLHELSFIGLLALLIHYIVKQSERRVMSGTDGRLKEIAGKVDTAFTKIGENVTDLRGDIQTLRDVIEGEEDVSQETMDLLIALEVKADAIAVAITETMDLLIALEVKADAIAVAITETPISDPTDIPVNSDGSTTMPDSEIGGPPPTELKPV